MEEESAYSDALRSNDDELDETRNNEAHPRHVIRQHGPCTAQGPCPSKPFEGLEQCLLWHQQAWAYLSHACPCHRRRCVNSQFEEPTQPRVLEGHASHRGYPILKTPHTTKQALTCVRDRVQDHEPHDGLDPYSGPTRIERTPGVPSYSAGMDMRSGGTISNFDRISAKSHGVMNTRRTEHDTRQRHLSGVPSTYLASRPLLGRDGQDSEGLQGNRLRPVTRGTNVNPTMHGTSDHGDSRRLASGLPANLFGSPGTEAQGSYLRVDRSALGRQIDPGDRRTSNRRSSTPGSDVASPNTGTPISNPYPMEGNQEDGTTTSGSTQTTIPSRTWNSNTIPRGTVLRRDRVTGRTRMVVTGEFIPEDENPRVFTINVGTLKATTSDEDKYCMLDSDANVMVVPLMRDMRGDRTMCSLVGDNKTQGMIISRLYTETRSYLVVAVENASVLLPPAYLVRIAGYRLAWENVPGGEYFKLQDGYGEPVAVQEDDDLLFLGKNTLWRVGHDMYRFAHRQTGMTWSEIWEQLTGENLTIQAITNNRTDQSVDFVELFNPGNFKEQKSSLVAGGTYDVRVNSAIDLTRDSVRQQVRKDIEKEDPLIHLGMPHHARYSHRCKILTRSITLKLGKRRNKTA